MRILLINPPIPHVNAIREHYKAVMELVNRRELIGPPLALNDIAGVLRNEEVRIADLKFEYDENKDFDLEKAIHNEVATFGPDIVGLTCLTAHVNSAKKILGIVKSLNSKILTIVGGLHATMCPEDFCMPEGDVVVIGPGKRTMRDIVDAYKANPSAPDFSAISGLGIRVDGKLKYTRQFSEMSRNEIKNDHYLYYDKDEYFPNRELTRRYNYIIEMRNLKLQYINTSLGCTDKCTFCGLWQFACGYFITRDVETIVREVKTMGDYPVIRMVDSHTFGDINHARLMFEALLRENLRHGYIVDARTDSVVGHPDVVELAGRAGVKVAIIGFEATTDEELERYKKRTTVNNTVEAINILHGAGISCAGNFIINPDYDERDFECIAKFVEDHPILFAGFSIMTPFPGTPQYEEMKDRIINKNLDYYNLTNAVVKTRLPEDDFYNRIVDLYKLSKRMREVFMKQAEMKKTQP